MESAKVCGLLAATFLLLTMLADTASGCMCRPMSPVQKYCAADFVLNGRFLGVTEDTPFDRHYRIQILNVYKGPRDMLGEYDLYTASQSNLCGYVHPYPFANDEEYLLTGRMYKDRLSTTLCHLNKKWKDVTPEEHAGMLLYYETRCKYLPSV